MRHGRLYNLINFSCLALYEAGLSVVAAFTTNTRIVGVRDSHVKPLIILANVAAWPLLGLLDVLRIGGVNGFLASLARPASLRWLWRVFFTLLGARYIAQEVHRRLHPRPYPQELIRTEAYSVDIREDVARAEGITLRGIQALKHRINEIYELEVTTREIYLERLSADFDGFTIVQLSDIHYGDFTSAEFVRRMVSEATGLSPDLIALTGDYQTHSKDIKCAAHLLSPIGAWSQERGGDKALAVLGNHDNWAGTAAVTDALREVGIKVLNNNHVELRRGRASLYITGVADTWSLRTDLPLALHGIPPVACTILLAHVPDFLVTSALYNVDLQLSGHIHGGQVKLPVVGAVFSSSRYNRRYLEGVYKRDRTLMYVSRGLGGHPPFRWGSKPELARLILRRGSRITSRSG